MNSASGLLLVSPLPSPLPLAGRKTWVIYSISQINTKGQSTVRTCPVNVKKVQSSVTGSIIELNVFYTVFIKKLFFYTNSETNVTLLIRALRELFRRCASFAMAALLLLPILHLKSYEAVHLRPQVICAARQALLIHCLHVQLLMNLL